MELYNEALKELSNFSFFLNMQPHEKEIMISIYAFANVRGYQKGMREGMEMADAALQQVFKNKEQ